MEQNNNEPENPTPKVDNKGVTISRRTLALIVGIILFLLIVGGVSLYALYSRDNGGQSNVQNGDETELSQDEELEDNRDGEPIQTVATEVENVEMEFNSYQLRDNTLVLNFTYVCTDCEAGGDRSNFRNPSWRGKLKDSYLTDDATSQRYNVIVDEDGNPLTSNIDVNHSLFSQVHGYRIGFYVTVTAPARGSTVDIFISGSQPITDITLE